MSAHTCRLRCVAVTGGLCTLVVVGSAMAVLATRAAQASLPCRPSCRGGQAPGELGGTWYWLRSPVQERQVAVGLYNRYCIRCHGVDGRGVWDIPDVPDFTDPRWQASRSDGDLARITLEGRGAVMPPFRGTLTLEEAWAMARYLRTLVPGSERPRPESRRGGQPAGSTPPAKRTGGGTSAAAPRTPQASGPQTGSPVDGRP